MDQAPVSVRAEAPGAAQGSRAFAFAIKTIVKDDSDWDSDAAVRAEQRERLPGAAMQVVLSPSALQDLPNDLLQARLLHLPGLHFPRRVCKAWRAACGPLTGGLCLTPTDLLTHIAPILTADPHRYAHITALHLFSPNTTPPRQPSSGAGSSRRPPPPSPPPSSPAAAFSALLRALPNLLSLSDLDSIAITKSASAEPHALCALPSLTPRLTALSLAAPSSRLPLRSADLGLTLQALSSLRALTIHCPLADLARSTCYQLQMLSMLTGLESLDVRHDDVCTRLPPTPWFTALGGLSRLTALTVGPGLTLSSESCVATLATGLARLHALTLPPCAHAALGARVPDAGGASGGPVVLALCRLTGLTALDLCINGLTGDLQEMGVLGLLPQLRRLALAATCGCEPRVEACLAAVSLGSRVTYLRVHCYNWLHYAPPLKAVDLTAACLSHLEALSGCLEELELAAAACNDPGRLLTTLGQLTRLRVLRLQCVDLVREEGPHSVLPLSALRDLRVLEVSDWCNELSAGVLQLLGCFTRLRSLVLEDELFDASAVQAGDLRVGISDAGLLILLLVQHTLADLQLRHCTAVGGPGLAAVLPSLTCLTSLTLRDMAVATSPRLPQFLLPLPCSLRHLSLHLPPGARLAAGVRERLQADVDEQVDCALHVWEP